MTGPGLAMNTVVVCYSLLKGLATVYSYPSFYRFLLQWSALFVPVFYITPVCTFGDVYL